MLGHQPSIIGIVGLQGTGKTMVMTGLGYSEKLRGKQIYANYSLKYPYTYIDSLQALDNIHDGIVLLDEFWLWVFNRSSMSRINQDIVKIVMLNRKRGITILYTEQTYTQVDKLIRNVTNYWILPKIRPLLVPDKDKIENHVRNKYGYHNTEEFNKRAAEVYNKAAKVLQDPTNYYVKTEIYDANGYRRNVLKFKNLEFWGSLYNTYEEVEPHIKVRSIPYTIQDGIEMENHFMESIQNMPWIQQTSHLPNSGHGTGKKFDAILQTDYGKLGIDVKTTNQTRVSIHPENLQKQIINAETNQLIPFIVFPKQHIINKTEELKKPENWYAHPIENSYLLGLRQPPKYRKLAKSSIAFPDLPIFLENMIQA